MSFDDPLVTARHLVETTPTLRKTMTHIKLCAVGLQWHKMYRKCPEHPSSSLLTTAAERNKLSTGCYFFSDLVFSPLDMNVFVTDLTVEYVVTHVQGFSSGIMIIFFEKLGEI